MTAATDIQIGIAHGRLRSGTYGHALRQAFTCLGDAGNLSARLMGKAPPGEIFVPETVRHAAGDVSHWEKLAPITEYDEARAEARDRCSALKGYEAGTRRAGRRREAVRPIVGRRRELERLGANLDQVLAGHGRIVGIAAEAGVGKSRLVAEFARIARERGVLVAIGECQSYGANTSYFVWRASGRRCSGWTTAVPRTSRCRTSASRWPRSIPRSRRASRCCRGSSTCRFPKTTSPPAFDAKLRKASLEGLLVDCLRAQARAAPLLIALEDCHRIDPLSRDLLEVLARAIADLPVMIVLAYRPAAEPGGDLGIAVFPISTRSAWASSTHRTPTC